MPGILDDLFRNYRSEPKSSETIRVTVPPLHEQIEYIAGRILRFVSNDGIESGLRRAFCYRPPGPVQGYEEGRDKIPDGPGCRDKHHPAERWKKIEDQDEAQA